MPLPCAGSGLSDYSGDGGPAQQASLNGPQSVLVAPNGSIFVGDTSNSAIRRIDRSPNVNGENDPWVCFETPPAIKNIIECQSDFGAKATRVHSELYALAVLSVEFAPG